MIAFRLSDMTSARRAVAVTNTLRAAVPAALAWVDLITYTIQDMDRLGLPLS